MDKNDNAGRYRFEHFSVKIMLGDMRFSRHALRPGAKIPDLPVSLLDGASGTLLGLAGGKPLLLVTGSITCPMTVSSIDDLNDFSVRYPDCVSIVLVYVREAHPGEHFPQTQSLAAKREHATKFNADFGIRFPVIVDDIDGPLHHLLDVLPNSAHLIARDGTIIAQSLWAGDSGWLEGIGDVLAAGDMTLKRSLSQRMMMPFLRGAGYMHDTLNRAGPSAYRELALGAPPISLLARSAALFTVVPAAKRGLLASVLLTGLGVLIAGVIALLLW